MKLVSEIKKELAEIPVNEIPEAVKEYESDPRAGVAAAIKSCMKRYENHIKEQQRLDSILQYENKYYEKGIEYIAGIDEVGRGPLAGPVVTAAVILPKGCKIEGVNDSKKLSPKKREELYDIIMENAVDVAIGVCDSIHIDYCNILQATYSAMRAAVNTLQVKPQQLLVDAVTIPNLDIPQEAIVKGDALSMSIGAASIIAKVTRDRMMLRYAQEYPGYDFENNMGYGTPKHLQAIKDRGICTIHRLTFIK